MTGWPDAPELVRVRGRVPGAVQVVLSKKAGQRAGVEKLDVQLVGADGDVVVELQGFSSRVLEPGQWREAPHPDAGADRPMEGVLTLAPLWQAQTFGVEVESWPRADEDVVLVSSSEEEVQGLRQL